MKTTFQSLRDKYKHCEWHHDLKQEIWVVQAVNLYGKNGYVKFHENLPDMDISAVEQWLIALEDFRIKGQTYTRPVNEGRYQY